MTEAEIQDLLALAGLAPGRPALTAQQLNDRVMAVMEREWPQPMREARPDAFELWRAEMEPARIAAVEANLFNHGLAAYRAAVLRLARYRLAEGRPETVETEPTGAFDAETGEEIIETRTLPAIAPLPVEIEQPVYDAVTGAQTGTVLIANPVTEADDAERAAAQAVIDATAAEVIAFVSAQL